MNEDTVTMKIPRRLAPRVRAFVDEWNGVLPLRQQHVWDTDEEARLTDMWCRLRMSASQIAAALGPVFTNNMVIGKARRLGLPARPSPIRRAGEARG